MTINQVGVSEVFVNPTLSNSEALCLSSWFEIERGYNIWSDYSPRSTSVPNAVEHLLFWLRLSCIWVKGKAYTDVGSQYVRPPRIFSRESENRMRLELHESISGCMWRESHPRMVALAVIISTWGNSLNKECSYFILFL